MAVERRKWVGRGRAIMTGSEMMLGEIGCRQWRARGQGDELCSIQLGNENRCGEMKSSGFCFTARSRRGRSEVRL